MDFEELQRDLDRIMNNLNNEVNEDFEGYSPLEMQHILYYTLGPESPIRLKKLSEAEYRDIPMLNLVKHLTGLIAKNGEIKLTAKGFLPTKIVSELYQQGYHKEEQIESGITKLYKETDSMTVNLSRILSELSGLVKKRSGKISLTKTGEKIIQDDVALLAIIFETFAAKFNWAYYDGYGDNKIGQLGYGFSLILLSKYGKQKQLNTFYARKYLKAFPALLDPLVPRHDTPEAYASRCYSIRTFDRYLDYFGLVQIEKESESYNSKKYITITPLFDKLIEVEPPG